MTPKSYLLFLSSLLGVVYSSPLSDSAHLQKRGNNNHGGICDTLKDLPKDMSSFQWFPSTSDSHTYQNQEVMEMTVQVTPRQAHESFYFKHATTKEGDYLHVNHKWSIEQWKGENYRAITDSYYIVLWVSDLGEPGPIAKVISLPGGSNQHDQFVDCFVQVPRDPKYPRFHVNLYAKKIQY